MVRELFAHWEAVLVIVSMLLLFAFLAFGVGLGVYFVTSNFAPKVLATCAAVFCFAALCLMFFRFLLSE